MQLMFSKNDDGEISVQFKESDSFEEFTYSKMVKKIYDEKIIEQPEIQGGFTEKEKKSINEMIDGFRKVATEAEGKKEE